MRFGSEITARAVVSAKKLNEFLYCAASDVGSATRAMAWSQTISTARYVCRLMVMMRKSTEKRRSTDKKGGSANAASTVGEAKSGVRHLSAALL